MKNRQTIALLLTMSLLFALAVPAAAAAQASDRTAIPSRQTVLLDGNAVAPVMYHIEGFNYVDIRDIAQLLSGSSAQFNVDFDASAQAAVVSLGTLYTPAEGTPPTRSQKPAACVKSAWTLQVGGLTVNTDVYEIDGSLFFRLYDLGIAIGFGVRYDEVKNAVTITSAGSYSLVFDPSSYETETIQVDGTAITSRSFKQVPYVSTPLDAEQQMMNIYVPEAYYQGKSVNGYTIDTAPIYFLISVGGYMQGALIELDSEASVHELPANTVERRGNAMSLALAQGYVVVSPAARGRNSDGADGVGKGTAGLVDLKAAVRYLRYNDALIPGSSEKIIAEGQSAGGAMSSLVATTGNNSYFLPELSRIGAADERDDVFACISFCPITDLEYANNAYEWLFQGESAWTGGTGFPNEGGVMNADEALLSDAMSAMYPAYLNSLGLVDPETGTALTLNEDGTGSYLQYIERQLASAAAKGLASGYDGTDQITAENGFTIVNGTVTGANLRSYVQSNAYNRMKPVGAFDNGMMVWTGENNQFTLGSTADSNTHYDTTLAQAVAAATEKGATITGLDGTPFTATADPEVVAHMNPMNYLIRNQYASDKAGHYYIRVGAKDADTSLTVSANLALALDQHTDAQVDYAMRWGLGHTGQYDLAEEFAWLDSFCR